MKHLFLLFTICFLLSSLVAQEQFNIVVESEIVPKPLTIFTLSDTGYATVGGADINGLQALSISFSFTVHYFLLSCL